jgi:serine/threonine-protein kinase RsbW
MCDTTTGCAVSLPLEPGAPREVRGHLLRWLEWWSWPVESRPAVAVAVQEAVDNAVKHSGAEYGIGETDRVVWISGEVERCDHGRRLRFRVRDHGRWRRPSTTRGWRGLLLMTRLMERVRIHRGASGTTVTLLTGAAEPA